MRSSAVQQFGDFMERFIEHLDHSLTVLDGFRKALGREKCVGDLRRRLDSFEEHSGIDGYVRDLSQSLLTEEEVADLLRRLAAGESHQSIASDWHDLLEAGLSRIRQGRQV